MININKALDKEARSNVMDEKDTVYPILEQTIRDVSFKRQNTDILGSYRLRSQLYTSDVDLYEVVIGKTSSVKTRFQRKMRKLLNNDTIYIGDIKCGLYEPFRIIDETSYIHQGKVYRYDQKKALVRLDKLKDDKVLSKSEHEEYKKLLKPNPTLMQLNQIKKKLRLHILRWKPQDVINGYLKLRDGTKYPLKSALEDPSLFKMDIIKYDGVKFIDVSIIYDLRNPDNSKKKLVAYNTRRTLLSDIDTYESEEQWFKVLKRMFSLLKYDYKYRQRKQNIYLLVALTKIFNSQLGQVYQVKTMIDTLVFLMDSFKTLSKQRIYRNVNLIIEKLSNIYDKDVVALEKGIVGDLLAILKNKGIDERTLLSKAYRDLEHVLHYKSKQYVNWVKKYLHHNNND